MPFFSAFSEITPTHICSAAGCHHNALLSASEICANEYHRLNTWTCFDLRADHERGWHCLQTFFLYALIPYMIVMTCLVFSPTPLRYELVDFDTEKLVLYSSKA